LLRLVKKFSHLVNRAKDDRFILFIVGCQRSGTTLLSRIFERDFNSLVFTERDSKLVKMDVPRGIRLRPLEDVEGVISHERASLIVLKPLVESQNILTLLQHFQTAKALWMYRNFEDVAASNLKTFGMGNGIKNLSGILADEPGNWRSENVSAELRSILLEHFSADMNPYDAAALFWFARNHLFFDLGLDKNPRVILCKYEELLTNPSGSMKNIYSFLGRQFPGERIVVEVEAKGRTDNKSTISPQVRSLCQEMMDKLDVEHERQT
jgi:hypothetical protein